MENKLYSSTLDQIFEVIKISKTHYSSGSPINISTQIGINNVSKQYKVTYQTIEDGCRRRLGLKNIDEFRNLLIEYFNGKPQNLMNILKEHTYHHFYKKIDDFFGVSFKKDEKVKEQIQKPDSSFEQSTEVFSFRLDQETSKKLKMLVGYEGISTSEWISRTVKDKVIEDLQKILNSLFIKKQ